MADLSLLMGVGAPAASNFQPTDIAGLKLWYKADALALADATAVSSWTDYSGNSNAATASTTARPTYKTAIVNGKAVCRFDGTANVMVFTGLALTDFSMFFVAKRSNDAALLGGDTSTMQTRVGQGAVNKLSTYDGTNNPQSTTLGTNTTTTFSTLEFLRSSSTISFYQNGTAYSTGTMSGSLTFTRIGGFFLSNLINGDIAEIIVYDTSLSAANRASVESFLNTKYALY